MLDPKLKLITIAFVTVAVVCILHIVSQSRAPQPPPEVLLEVPFVFQKGWLCSEASASMVLRYYGFNVSQEDVHEAGYDRFETLLPFLRRYVECEYATMSVNDLRGEVNKGKPVIIRVLRGSYRHTLVVVGYDGSGVYIHDPAWGPSIRVSDSDLLHEWEPLGCIAIVFS